MEQRSYKVLIVEDNPGDLELIKMGLSDSEEILSYDCVEDGEEAISFLKRENSYSEKETPDFLLLDINLPKINGHEVLKFIKSDSSLSSVPVIVFTTSDSSEDITKAYKNYTNAYFTKPINAKEFIDTVKQIANFWVLGAKLP